MKRLNIIIVAEGAIDQNNKSITTDYIKDVSTVVCVCAQWCVQPVPLLKSSLDYYLLLSPLPLP